MKKLIKIVMVVALWSCLVMAVGAADRIVYKVKQISDNKIILTLDNLDLQSEEGVRIDGIEQTDEGIIIINYHMVSKSEAQNSMPFYYLEGQYPAPIYLVKVGDEDKEAFSDLNKEDPSFESIMNLYFKGVIGGYTDGTIKKDNLITREQFAKMMVVLGDFELDTTSPSAFKDVNKERWSRPYIMTLYNKGILTGDGSGNFNPEANVNIGAISAMLDRMFIFYEKSSKGTIGTGHWAYKHMQVLYEANIIKNGDIFFNNPNKNATRAEACRLLHRTILALKEIK